MSASAKSRAETSHPELDEALAVLKDHAREFARLSVNEKVSLLKACSARLAAAAPRWVALACEAKGLALGTPSSSEEWLGGPITTQRNIRLLVRSLEQIAANGKPTLAAKRFSAAPDGVTQVEVFPGDAQDAALFGGFSGKIRMQKGLSEADVREKQAWFYAKKDPEGGVSLVLGAGNVNSIPPMDALYKMFADGMVCIVKMNPVNEYLMPIFEEVFAPLVERGFLKFVNGGAEVGSYLCYHAAVADVHITGSDRTHDLIVWGAPGDERQRRIKENDPVLKKSISSELGCVTPVVIVPGTFSPSQLQFVADNVATMVTNNASCNCNAAKMIVTSKSWPQREEFLRMVNATLSTAAPRKAYYPGATQRFETLLAGRDNVQKLGTAGEGQLPWAAVFGLDGKSDDKLFTTEPFCPIISEATIDESDPAAFLAAATTFCNDKLWGTLSASVIIHPSVEKDPAVKAALEKSLADLRYGAVVVNHWPGLVYGTVTPPWGAHPSSTLANIQGGLGWVHNTFLLEGIEKFVMRGPLVVKPKPPWFVTNKNAHNVAEKLFAFESDPSWFKVPGIAIAALSG
jgi:aldehyde dehydrogenase (NAD(P)+)